MQAELIQRYFANVSADNPDHKYAHTLDLSRRDLRDSDIEQAVPQALAALQEATETLGIDEDKLLKAESI